MGGKPVRPPIIVTACLAERETGKVEICQKFRNRLPGLLEIKLASWLLALSDTYPRDKYRVIVKIESPLDGDPRVENLKNSLTKLGIRVVDEVLQVAR
ncbi:MAG: hypothetical protein J7J82_07515 [Staphylothermus sp.]|nr:hypothetical protein [Staphylothermus sp.]